MPRWVAPLVVALVAVGVRAAFLPGIEAYPKFELIRNRLDDQVFFHNWALAIVGGRPLDLAATGHAFAYWAQGRPGVFPQDPLYPWTLAAVYRAFGFEFDLVRWGQAILGAAAATLTCLLAQRLVRWPMAMLAGLAVALYGPLVFYEAAFLREAPAAAICVVVLWLIEKALPPGEPAHPRAPALLAASGVALGSGILLRSNLLLFAVAAAAWLSRAAGSRWLALVFAAGLAVPVLPVVTLNIVRSGSPALVSSIGPYNFFIGNVHDATGDSRGSLAYYDEVKRSGAPEAVPLYRLALEDIAAHPAAWVKLQIRKLLLLFSTRDIPDNLSYPMGGKCNPRLALAPVELHWILPAALAGLVLGWRQRRRLSLLYLFLAAYAVSVIAFFVVSRLQLPMVPVLAVFAALAVDRWWTAIQERRWVVAVLGGIVTLAASLWLRPSPDAYRPIDLEMAAASYFSRGMEEETAERPRMARRYYGRAVSLNPDHNPALARIVALGSGGPDGPPAPEAAALCEQARQAAASGRRDEARRLLGEAERLEPDWFLPLEYRANVDFLAGDHRQAVRDLEGAVERAPLDARLRARLQALRRSPAP